jgi:hypothetical protein
MGDHLIRAAEPENLQQLIEDDPVGVAGFEPNGLFVPKSSRRVRCQRSGLSGLGTIVRRCPLAPIVGRGDCCSLAYSVARGWAMIPGSDDHLDANYRRDPGRDQTVQPNTHVDARPGRP